MGMIDKEKLIEMFLKVNVGAGVVQIAENFPEEPEIDFDALLKEYEGEVSTRGFINFLKSKHLSAQKPKQLSVKKTGVLKSPDEILKGSCRISFVDGSALRDDDIGIGKRYELNLPEYCYKDITETPDYSQVKVGDVVEIYHTLSNKPNYGIVQKNINNMLSIICNMHSINAFCINYSQIKSLTILKAAE